MVSGSNLSNADGIRRPADDQVHREVQLAGKLATVLRESQADKENVVRTSMLRLQQQQMLLRSKLDRVYEDRLSDAIPMNSGPRSPPNCRRSFGAFGLKWNVTKSRARRTKPRGQILELAQTAYSSYVAKNSARTGASRKNTCIELDVRSRKSLSRRRRQSIAVKVA
jgi:hypothetical protein